VKLAELSTWICHIPGPVDRAAELVSGFETRSLGTAAGICLLPSVAGATPRLSGSGTRSA